MKIVFMGTPDFSVQILDELAKEHEVVCVYSQPPREAGRGQKVIKTPVHQFADEKKIQVRTPKSLKSTEEQESFKSLGADLAVVAAYGLILPKPILEAFPRGCINVHASLLPRWRGAAPIQRAIEAGDEVSGVTIMQMNEGLDTGDMLLKAEIAITPETTGGELHDKLSSLGSELIVKTLKNLDNIVPEKQDDALAVYAPKIDKAEARLYFNQPAIVLDRKIRAFNPYPATFFEYKGERFKVLEVEVFDGNSGRVPGSLIPNDTGLLIECNPGMLLVTKIQRQCKKCMDCCEMLKGFEFEPNTILF